MLFCFLFLKKKVERYTTSHVIFSLFNISKTDFDISKSLDQFLRFGDNIQTTYIQTDIWLLRIIKRKDQSKKFKKKIYSQKLVVFLTVFAFATVEAEMVVVLHDVHQIIVIKVLQLDQLNLFQMVIMLKVHQMN